MKAMQLRDPVNICATLIGGIGGTITYLREHLLYVHLGNIGELISWMKAVLTAGSIGAASFFGTKIAGLLWSRIVKYYKKSKANGFRKKI